MYYSNYMLSYSWQEVELTGENKMYLVIRILRRVSDGTYTIEAFPYDNENAAKHQFHQIMATYAYGNNDNYDYVSGEIRTRTGATIFGPEIDDRIPIVEPEVNNLEE